MRKAKTILASLLALSLAGSALAQPATPPFGGQGPQGPRPQGQAPQGPRQWNQDVDRSQNDLTLDMYFIPVGAQDSRPDSEGFIRRWSLLDPIDKPNRTNTVFTDSYIREAFAAEYFPEQMTLLPKDGQKVKLDKKTTLQWHNFDSRLYNVKLFRFASELDHQVYGVIFWAVTAIDVEEDLVDVRLSVGSNSASMWWIDGQEAVILSGDRRMVADDCASKRLTLTKGRHIIRGAVINGPGMSDFCVRIVDECGKPVRNYSVSTNYATK